MNKPYLTYPPPCPSILIVYRTHTKAFILEMTDTAQMKWFDEFETTQDKKGLVTKVSAIR